MSRDLFRLNKKFLLDVDMNTKLFLDVIVVTRGQYVTVFKHRLKHVNVKFIHNNEFD